MRILAIDPGAARMGWAIIQGGEGVPPVYVASGIFACPRGATEKYQPYRLRLISGLSAEVDTLLDTYTVAGVACETVPVVSGGAFSSNGVQAQLAATSNTVVQTIGVRHGLSVSQVAAITVKKAIGGSKTASKVKVRNGVYSFFPQIKEAKWSEWVRVHDESDACAVGLTALGYTL